jgi:hypothetical protein
MSKRNRFLNFVFIIVLAFSIIAWTWPTEEKTITSDFGPRHITGEAWQFHLGIDIRGEKKKIYAAEDGEAWGLEGSEYNTIVVKHNSKTSRYLHCSSVDVPIGEKNKKEVKAGDIIGVTGDKGCKKGDYHLDFRFEDESHPLKYLPYTNSADPTVQEFITPKDGDKVKGTIDVKVYVVSTPDMDLNRCELYIDDELLKEGGTISYDPNTNCSSTTAFPKEKDGVGEDFFVFKWNTNEVENGKHTLKVVATDAGDKTGENSIEVEVENAAPVIEEKCVEKEGGSLQQLALSNSANLSASMEGRVCFLFPQAEDIPVDVSKFYFTFSKPMDEATTTPAVSADFGFTTSWDGYETIELNLTDNLEYCKKYTVTISGDATDTFGVHLDGNEDGEPGGDYEFTFTTESPELLVRAYPTAAHVGEGQSVTPHVIIDGSKLKDDVDCNIRFDVHNPGGWFVSGANDAIFSLSPADSFDKTYSVSNNSATATLHVLYQLGAECLADSGEGYYWTAEAYQNDHPDENQSPGVAQYPTPWITQTEGIPVVSSQDRGTSSPPSGLPDIGILLSGWADGYGHILGKYGIETLPVKPDLKIINHPDINISDSVKLLVIGSAGLKGFISQEFKKELEEYVVNGGNLLVFTQKYGSDLSVLPGNIEGYGWNEDQACFAKAAYLNQWHPVFSGQTRQLMYCNVDGYLSEYPNNAEILLGRTKNGMPALLTYNYGAGTVIVSSLYSDWGYGHRKFSSEELSLIRDLTTWAQNPDMAMPEFYRGSAVSIPVSIKYTANDTSTTATAIIKVYTPDRKLYDSTAIPVSLHSGEETEWLWNKSSLASDIGLWVIDYALQDGGGKWIQGYNRGAVFAHKLKVQVGNYALGDFQLWVNAAKEEVLKGDTVDFEVFIKNITDSVFIGKLMIGHHNVVVDSLTNLTLPPDSIVNITYKQRMGASSRTWRFGLYKSDQYEKKWFTNALAGDSKGIWIIENPFEVSITKDKYRYVVGSDTVNYKFTVESKLSDTCSPFVNIYTVLDSVRYDVWEDTVALLAKGGKEIEGEFFPIDYDTIVGKNRLFCELFYRGKLWNSSSVDYYLSYPAVKCSLALPDSFNYGDTNLYSVKLTSERGYLPSGKLLLSGRNYSDSLIIDQSSGLDTILVFDYKPDVWENVLGNKITIKYKIEESFFVWEEKNLNFCLPILSDFRPQYTRPQGGFLWGDTAVFKAQGALTGNLYGVPLVFSLWSDYLGSDTLRDTIILNPCKRKTIMLKTYTDMSIPADTMISYNYQMKYLNKEYSYTGGKLQYFVQSSEAMLHWPVGKTFSIGATIPITFTNSIKAPSRVDIQAVYLHDIDYEFEENFTGPREVIVPGESSYTFDVTVPQWLSGKYYLSVQADMVEGRGINLDLYQYNGCPIYIDGIEANIQVSTSKDYYGYGENIPFSSLLENGRYGWEGAESLKVARVRDSIGEFSIWGVTEYIDTFGLIPDGGGGLVLDSVYSLRCLYGHASEPAFSNAFNKQAKILSGYSGSEYSLALDESNILWASYNRIIEKIDFISWRLLEEFRLPDSVGDVEGLAAHQGTLYIIASDSGRVYKMNSTSGDIMGNIQPPGRRFLDLTGVAVKEGGNVLAVEDGTKILWEFSNSGDSISALELPSELYYGDMDYQDGIIYISTPGKIVTVEGTSVDSFGVAPDLGYYYGPIDIDDNGKIVVAGNKWPGDGKKAGDSFENGYYGVGYLRLFSSTGSIEAEIYSILPLYDLFFYKGDIISLESEYSPDIAVYREFGINNGLIRAGGYGGWFENLPEKYRFLSYKSSDVGNSGSILYQVPGPLWTPVDEDLMPLESMYGADYLLSLYITMQGDWHDSSVFYDCSLKLKVLDVLDSLIVENDYPLNLSPLGIVSFVDTIKDIIPPADYCVLGDVYYDYPKNITSDSKLFTVIGNNLTLILKSDKEEGFAGEPFRINPLAINPLPLSEDSLHLLVKGYFNETETTYVDTSFVLSAESTDSFPFVIMPDEPLVVRAELILPSSDTITREFTPIVKSTRLLSLEVSAPDVVDLLPFKTTTDVYNYSFDSLLVEIKRIFSSDTLRDSINLEKYGVYTFVDSFFATSSDTLRIIATTGGEVFTKRKFIDLGIKGNITLDSLFKVSPDSVMMSGIIRNEGVYPLEGNALFCLMERSSTQINRKFLNFSYPATPAGYGTQINADFKDLNYPTTQADNGTRISADGRDEGDFSTIQPFNNLTADLSAQQIAISSVTRVGKDLTLSAFLSQLVRAGIDTSFSAIYLSSGKSDTIPISFDKHNAGNYTLRGFLFAEPSSVMLDSTSSSVNVVGNDQVFVDSLLVSPTCDSTGTVSLYVVLNNDSYSPFSGNLTINSPVLYQDSTVDLSSGTRDTVIFLLPDPIDEGEYAFTATISEGGVPVSEKIQKLEFHPIYKFDSLPFNLEVSTPDSGIIDISVSNIGNGKGERNVRVNLADAISINEYAIIDPSSSDTFTTNFLIPEDFPGGEYFADASILKNLYPEVDTFFKVNVNGLVIRAKDSLDKLVYSVSDTAALSILIKNQSLWSGDLLASLQYGQLELDTSFVLGGMEKGILNTTLNRDTLYLDASSVYMSDPVSSESYDSVSINWDISSADSISVEIRTDSVIGRGNWTSIEEDTVYPVSEWTQLKMENKSLTNQWINSLVLNFKPSVSIILDSFPVQEEIITLDVPVDSSEVKLGWGIYYPSGRSVVLDERYVYLTDSMLTIFTDKGRYEISDTVHATLVKHFSDTSYAFAYRVYFSPTEEKRDSFELKDDTTRFSFVIPEWTRSGTYSIDYQVDGNGTQMNVDFLSLTYPATPSGYGTQINADFKDLNYPTTHPKNRTQISADKQDGIDDDQSTNSPINQSTDFPRESLPEAKQWVLGKPQLSALGDSALISGEHLFDVDGITVYFKNARMDTNLYFNGESAKIRTEISSDVDLTANLNISSTGSFVRDIALDLEKDIPNKFEFDYPITGCERGMNELYLHLAKDSTSLAGYVLYFDVYVSDTLAPLISILREPENTYSSNRFYELIARIYDPDTSGTPFTDTLYYRIASSGGGYWQSLSAHSMKGDTNKYLIPSQPNGTHIQYHLIARDEFGNAGRYPEEGEQDFWVLSPLRATWEQLTYSAAPSAILQWNSPRELVYYHCGLSSDTININETELATRFTSQYLPATLEKIGLDIIKESTVTSSDTVGIYVYTVEENLLPGTKTDSFEFTGTFTGYTEFALSNIRIPEDGIFVGIKGSSKLNAILDGFGEGTHTVMRTGGLPWQFMTPGELLIDALVSHAPSPHLRGPSDVFSFDVFRSTDLSNWTKIASGLTGNTYTDTLIQENREYSYKIMVSFGNPEDSFFSVSRAVFIDYSPPRLDTISINKSGDNNLLVRAVIKDTSGIAWDSLGYRNGSMINVISEDSSKNDEYFFSFTFTEDTLLYFLKAQDLSLTRNYIRYPETGFYKWGNLSGIADAIPDSTYLCRMLNTLISRDIEIKYALSERSKINIVMFDITGRRVRTLIDETQKAGYYSVPMRSSDLPYGVYFLRMQAGDYKKTLKLVKVR